VSKSNDIFKYRYIFNQYISVSILYISIQNIDILCTSLGCGPLDATNASKHSIDQSKDRILQINQSKNASKHS